MCSPLKSGGLGVRNLRKFNKTLLVNGCGGTAQRQTTFGNGISRSSMGIFGVGGVQKK